MARYMLFWEADTSRTPEDPKAKKAQWLGFQELTKKSLKEGIIKEWGQFAGQTRGYAIFEGSAVELQTTTAKWVPFTKFKVGEILTVGEVITATKALPD